MSKLFDSLTGYFFSGDQHGGTATAEPLGQIRRDDSRDASRDASVDGDSADLSPAQFRADDSASGVRLRDRLWLRRPIQRSTPSPATTPAIGRQKPWGDDEIASPRIHPLAVIDPRAELAADVEIGPFCVIGPHVTLGPGCKLHNNVTITGHTTVGSDNVFFPNCVIGADPQDKKFKGEPTRLIIGDGNLIREAVTIHVGTEVGGGVTRVGDGNLLMVNCHIGHDVTLGNNNILANNVMLAGHCHIGNRVSMMGAAALHHFVSIGDFVFVGGYARVHHDVPPYVKVDGADEIRGINVIGLRRGGMSDEDIAALEIAARRLFYGKKKPMSVAIGELLADESINPRVKELVDFLRRRNLGTKGRYLESLRHG